MPKRRASARRTTSTSLIATFVVMACLGLAYLGQQVFSAATGGGLASPGDATATAAPGAGNATSAPAVENWYQLYFTSPVYPDDDANRPARSVADPVIVGIASARFTVDAATYEFNLPAMAEALIAAHNRGVTVRLVTDTDTMDQDAVQSVAAAGIPVVEDDKSAIMHDKFVIVDSASVWTGSWNFTENDTYRNNNNLINIAAPEMVANYQAEFNEMFEQRDFGAGSPANTPYPQFTVGGVLIENYFSPDDDVAQHILAAIQSATRSIYFAAFTFTRDDFSQALIERAGDGVSVQGVYESRQVAAGSDQSYNALTGAGLPVLEDGNAYTMHHKFMIIDGSVVVTGSYNFSKAAEQSNDENVLIIHDPAIAAQYLKEFAKVWRQAGGK
ncbi:MAG: DUF1669 domain-containing protein [Chloroflexi bacterium]|nr:DUF1669 domain-containing protein [Chloroflexota bacterium]